MTATPLDKAIIIGRSFNNAVAIANAEEGEAVLSKIVEIADALVGAELELYEKYGAGGSEKGSGGGGTPSTKPSWGGSGTPASAPSSSGGSGRRPTDKQANVLRKYLGWSDEAIANAPFDEWKAALDAHFPKS